MRQKHGGSIALPDFKRVHAQVPFMAVDIKQNLRRFADAGNRFEGMTVSQNRKIGNSI